MGPSAARRQRRRPETEAFECWAPGERDGKPHSTLGPSAKRAKGRSEGICAFGLLGELRCLRVGSTEKLDESVQLPLRQLQQAQPSWDVTDLALGSDYACSLGNAQLWCWGDGAFGRQRRGAHDARAQRVLLVGAPGVRPRADPR